MKITKRILSTLLAVTMVLSAFVALMTVPVSAATTETETVNVPIENYVTKVYNNPQEKLATMQPMRTYENHQLWVDVKSGEIAYVELDADGNPTENILFSNPYDVAASKGSESTKQELLSQIIVAYKDTTGTSKNLYSYKDAALNDQIKVQLIKGGVRVEYIIGREDGRKLIPRLILDSSFDPNILANIREVVERGELLQFDYDWFVNAWQKIDPNEMSNLQRIEFTKKYPVLGEYYLDENGETVYPIIWLFLDKMVNVSDMLKREEWIKMYCPDYTFEQLDLDHEATGYEAEDEKFPVFKMALEYYMDENGLSVRLPCNGLRYDMSSYTLENLSVLPYMGASNYKNAGFEYSYVDESGNMVEDVTTSYTFFPDGSGALFDHAQLGTSTEKLLGYVYGEDFAYHQLLGLKFQKVVRYPVYGTISSEAFYEYTYSAPDPETGGMGEPITVRMSNTVKSLEQIETELETMGATLLSGNIADTLEVSTRGFVAFVEDADSLTRFQLYHGGALHNYSTVYPYFNPKPNDSYDLSDAISASSSKNVNIQSDRRYTGSFTLRFVMLKDEDSVKQDAVAPANEGEQQQPTQNTKFYPTTWLGMAEAYRDYLCNKGILNKNGLAADKLEEDIPLYIEVFGALETQETIATIPVWVMTPLTTFDNVLTMYNELGDYNVKNINFKMTGFANGGMYATMPSSLKWEKKLGGKDGFQALADEANRINALADGSHLGLYPDFNFAYIEQNTLFDGVNLKEDAIKTIDNRYTMFRSYNAAQQSFTSFYQLAISPSRFSKFYTKLMENYEIYGVNSMSVATLGTSLNSDFDEEEMYNREESKEFTTEALADFKNAGYSLMVEGGNSYTWAYVDHILNVDLDSSRYLEASATVPFIGAVLHGYVQFAGAPLNEEGNVNYAILRAIENGAGIYFILSYQNTTELKEDSFLSQYYSIRYDIWLEDVAKYYNELNTVLKDLQDKQIIDHEFLVGERVLDLDELEADISNRLENAIKDENKLQEDSETEDVISVANAWSLLYHSEETMKEILDLVNEANSEVESVYDEFSSRLSFSSEIKQVFTDYLRVDPEVEGSDALYKDSIDTLSIKLSTLRAKTAALAQLAEDIRYLQQRCDEMVEAMDAAIELMKTTEIYNKDEATRAKLLAQMEAYHVEAVKYVTRIANATSSFFDPEQGYDYLNPESSFYFLDEAVKTITAAFVTGFGEGGIYAADENAETVYADIMASCKIFTKEQILAQVQVGGADEEDEDDSDGEIGAVNNNQIAVVTYGDRDIDTFAKTPYKSIILNYNSYAVRVTYNGVLYTVPSGGYIIIMYDNN